MCSLEASANETLKTSALDTSTEQSLLHNINSILKDKARTSVFVAHRLRTIYDSDRIIVLQEGNVAESGTHNQLIDIGGVYSELWSGMTILCLTRLRLNANHMGSAQETMFTDEDGKIEER